MQKVPRSLTSGFNPCVNNVCGQPAVRPLVDTGVMVFVVFGILGLNRTENHVIGDMGNVIYDENFDLFKEIGSLCKLCKVIGNNAVLVKPGGAQCLPTAVQSVLCSLLLSLVICVAAVVFFTAHMLLLLPVLLSILGELCLVVAMMYCAGWEMGAVEAISLSILVGFSVDYCVHLVEGFLLAEESPPSPSHPGTDESAFRQWRTLAAVNQVGVAIVSSAVTTIIATVPLFFCIIAPFTKFGKIIALNMGISVLYTLTVCTALLSTLGPVHFSRTRAAVLKAGSAVLVTAGTGLAVGWTLGKLGVKIPFPTAADG
ncbi:Patched domain-containing protein 2 [Acipenser ruthenus]|uniref:Patched domain-containing protein 2 n=1 Tax=Acipenser ruthenus TaxID=7906 RepID=A0A444V2A5_ACIRT|nr:Patched domain-containing protein 2 [Acipenser ruthenus]